MNNLTQMFLLAHGGGGKGQPMDPRVAGLVGTAIFFLAFWQLAKGLMVGWRTGKFAWDRFWFGGLLGCFSYIFLAQAFGWPGSAVALQIFLVAFLLPFLTMPWLLFKALPFLAKRDDPIWDDLCESLERGADPRALWEKQLKPGEVLLWVGQPSPFHFRGESWAMFVFGWIPLAFGIAALTMMLILPWGDGFALNHLLGMALALIPGIGFTLIGLIMIQSPWRVPRNLTMTSYALTSHRGLVVTSPAWFWNPVPNRNAKGGVMEFSPEEIRNRVLRKVGLWRKDWIFFQEVRGGGKGRSVYHYGFLGLADPAEVGAILDKEFAQTGQLTEVGR